MDRVLEKCKVLSPLEEEINKELVIDYQEKDKLYKDLRKRTNRIMKYYLWTLLNSISIKSFESDLTNNQIYFDLDIDYKELGEYYKDIFNFLNRLPSGIKDSQELRGVLDRIYITKYIVDIGEGLGSDEERKERRKQEERIERILSDVVKIEHKRKKRKKKDLINEEEKIEDYVNEKWLESVKPSHLFYAQEYYIAKSINDLIEGELLDIYYTHKGGSGTRVLSDSFIKLSIKDLRKSIDYALITIKKIKGITTKQPYLDIQKRIGKILFDYTTLLKNTRFIGEDYYVKLIDRVNRIDRLNDNLNA